MDVVARLSLDRNSKYFFVKYIMNGRLKVGWTTLIFSSLYILCLCHIDNSYFSMSDGPGFAGLLDNLHIDGPTKARITPFEADSVLSKPWIYPFASLVVVRKAVAFTY